MLLMLCLACTREGGGNINMPVLADALDRGAIVLPAGSPLQYPDALFDSLGIHGRPTIVGVGEATHGTREFMELKQRLFRYLVEKRGFRILAKEFSYEESLLINDYVLNGTGNPDSLCAGLYWIHNNHEAIEVIRWMHDWNVERPSEEKVMFIGIDSQLDMLRMERHADHIRRYDEGLYQYCAPALEMLLAYRRADYHTMDKARYDSIMEAVQGLQAAIREYYGDNRAGTKGMMMLQLATALEQAHRFLFHLSSDDVWNYREEHLTRNLLWACTLAGDSSGVMLWAHNAHVARNPLYGEKEGGAMGWRLEALLGEKYLSVATTFARGSFTAVNLDADGRDTPPLLNTITEDPPDGSVNRVLLLAEYPDYVVDFARYSREPALLQYLDTLRPFIDIGDLYMGSPAPHYTAAFDAELNVRRSYDVIFFFRETHGVGF
jgi:erythromycin esterase